MIVFYRISDKGYAKVKPDYVNNENCLRNFLNVFYGIKENIYIIADNCTDSTLYTIEKYVSKSNIIVSSLGNGAGTFNLAMDKAIDLPDYENVYFVENDYFHKPGSLDILYEGFSLGDVFVSLYDHPDKYMTGVNPYVEEGGEVTKVFLTDSCHWKMTNSTTMTFAGKVKMIKKYEHIFRKHTSSTHPHDFDMWIELRNQGVALITPIPGYSTHGETQWLTPLTDWSKYASSNS